ncbi:long-chain-fatty-acid--CoA ligase [Polymorphum gilvum]|uniref:3-methylmercaptopropionyl-CoA ligase n=1 Tax=Polymorphum gilvum (strain LMG 25793 / CGMCC 1.9160 / SL003B-26A1) TaxID=991905 RepID=F2IY95_POLGS|nr:long-chain-fatty-acid--CoA ligase [Polymorphum gilvum]ADZ71707.1 Putative ACYL-COA synthetase ligase protein; alkK-like protein [Polymorphum gilvum SL003B-26A1]
MLGLMQDWPLTCTRILDHAARNHGRTEIVSRTVEGPIHRTDYASLRQRALQLAKRLDSYGITHGDRVATLAWNTVRHMEVWYGLLGLGAIYHTVNPRLFPDQIAWIVNHAEDRLLFVDLTFLPIVEKIWPQLRTIERVVVLTDAAHMPETSLPKVAVYEDWLAEADADFAWKDIGENAAAGMCYTSGTTGDPKGVVYSHRSNVLHAMTAAVPDMLGLRSRDRVMPVVPLFHANGWSLAFSAPLAGAALVLPGPRMDGESIWGLLDAERVTLTAAVPTVWLMLLQYLKKTGKALPWLERVVIGGSACPRAMTKAFEEDYDVRVMHAWGMTEMSPLGTVCSIKADYAGLAGERLLDIQEKQGFAPFGVEMKITDDVGRELPWDGRTFGRLKVRGPAIASGYFRNDDRSAFDDDGFFDTGDVAHIDPAGYMQITDRSKDVIKSGGEWISSIELENVAVGHPDVAEAAVIGVAHPRWDERPLLIVVPKEGARPTRDSLLAFMDGKVAKWWLPDDVVVVDEIPHTATGKIRKTALREAFSGYRLPTAE